LGRTAVTEIESGSKWQCYICKPEKFKEPRALAKKVWDSAQLYEKYQESKQLDCERRKLEKFEKKKKIISEEKKYVGDGAESTDTEDLEIKVIKLLQCLEKVVEQNERPIAKKRRFSKIVKRNSHKLSRLRTKAGRTIEEMKNGTPEANVDIAGSSDDAADAELLGLTRKSKKKAVNGKRSKPLKPDKTKKIRTVKPKPPPPRKKSRIVLKSKRKSKVISSEDDDDEIVDDTTPESSSVEEESD